MVNKFSADNKFSCCQLTDDTSRPCPVDERLPEGAVRLADDLHCGWGIVVVLKELPLWAMVLQLLPDSDSRVAVCKDAF